MPENSDFLCDGWVWDPVMRELRKYERGKKGWKDEPEAVQRLEAARAVKLHFWSQPAAQAWGGEAVSSKQSRVVVEYERGGNIEINEHDRACAEKLAGAIAGSYSLDIVREGAPGGRRGGNLPERDSMGRLVNKTGKTEVILDETARELTVATKRFPVGKKRRTLSIAELRRLELGYEVTGAEETYTVWGIAGIGEEERIPLASYTGFEGWADPQEWRDFTEDLARSLGIEAHLPDQLGM